MWLVWIKRDYTLDFGSNKMWIGPFFMPSSTQNSIEIAAAADATGSILPLFILLPQRA
jgi:hypothetical protein